MADQVRGSKAPLVKQSEVYLLEVQTVKETFTSVDCK